MRATRPIPGFGRTATALAIAGASSEDSRLAALVLCTVVILAPTDAATGAITVRPLALAHRLAAHEAEVRDGLAWLVRASLLGETDPSGSDAAELDAAELTVFANWARVAAPPVASVVDWATIVERFAGQPAALSVALAFAESTVAPGEQTPITVPQLVAGARYSDRTVKAALARLVEQGVLVRGPRVGARNRYAFSEAALGLAPFSDAIDLPPVLDDRDGASSVDTTLAELRDDIQALRALMQSAAVVAPRPGVAPTSPVGSASLASLPVAASPVYLEIQGIRVALPPGATLELDVDATGRLWYRMGSLRLGPIER